MSPEMTVLIPNFIIFTTADQISMKCKQTSVISKLSTVRKPHTQAFLQTVNLGTGNWCVHSGSVSLISDLARDFFF